MTMGRLRLYPREIDLSILNDFELDVHIHNHNKVLSFITTKMCANNKRMTYYRRMADSTMDRLLTLRAERKRRAKEAKENA